MTVVELNALLDERKQLTALFHESRIARGINERLRIEGVEKAIATLLQDGLDERDKVSQPDLLTQAVIDIWLALRRNPMKFEQPGRIWDFVGVAGVGTSEWPRILQQRVLALCAPLDYILELDPITE